MAYQCDSHPVYFFFYYKILQQRCLTMNAETCKLENLAILGKSDLITLDSN